jgi:hypothetical protein
MPPTDVLPDPFFHVPRAFPEAFLRKERVVYLLGRIASCPADNHLIVLFVPFEHGAGTHAELLANLGWHGDLTLGSEL